LSEHSFLKSAEERENEGFIIALFLQKSERVEQGRELNAVRHDVVAAAGENENRG
jgi:hypothetical protein